MVIFAQTWMIMSYKEKLMMYICLWLNQEIKMDRWRWPTLYTFLDFGFKTVEVFPGFVQNPYRILS